MVHISLVAFPPLKSICALETWYFLHFFLPTVDLILYLSREAGIPSLKGKWRDSQRSHYRKALEWCPFGRTFRASSWHLCFNQRSKVSRYHITAQLFHCSLWHRRLEWGHTCPPTKNQFHRIVEAMQRGSMWYCCVNCRVLKRCYLSE